MLNVECKKAENLLDVAFFILENDERPKKVAKNCKRNAMYVCVWAPYMNTCSGAVAQ